MSKPLGYYDPILPEGATPTSLITSLKANALACGWQVLHEDTGASPSIDLIPPVSQSIGNALGREVIRLRAPATGNVLEMWIYLEALPSQTHSPYTLQCVGSVSVDYTYGFIYVLSLMERSLSLSTKTNTTLQGALVASYCENAIAVASTPAGVIPIELVGADLAAANASNATSAVVTHVWGYAANAAGYELTVTPPTEYGVTTGSTGYACDVLTGKIGAHAGVLANLRATTTNYTIGDNEARIPVLSTVVACAGIPEESGQVYIAIGQPKAVSVAVVGATDSSALWDGVRSYPMGCFLPSVPLPDMTVFKAAGNNEGLHLVRSHITTTLQTAMDATTDYPVFTLGSVADLPTSGCLVIGDECFPYTGKSGSTVTGYTRGAYATAKAAHAIGATVYLAAWVVKINGAAVHAGTTKPGDQP